MAGNRYLLLAELEYLFQLYSSEIYNNADTHVFGKDLCVFFTTSKKCTVSLFLTEYSEKVDVPIVTGATAAYLKNGSTVILIIGKGL